MEFITKDIFTFCMFTPHILTTMDQFLKSIKKIFLHRL